MRYFSILFLACFVLGSCVKKAPKDPIPELEYKNFQFLNYAGSDSAVFTLGYKDWDGDLFRNDNSDGPNTVLTTYVYNTSSQTFVKDTSFAYVIIQPADGYYKGKSIQGDIIIPVNEFRSSSQEKIFKFEFFMVDMKNNKSNVVSSPQYTLQ